MGFMEPNLVVSPKNRWKLESVLYSTGQDGWSLAEGLWENDPVLAIRWNGDDDSGSIGNPQSHGNPTWLIIPNELQKAIREAALSLKECQSGVSCKIYQPEGYEWGVFKIVITLSEDIRKAINNVDVIFSVPKMANRFFRVDKDYRYILLGEQTFSGQFKNGVWEGTVQTNGISEDTNITTIAMVYDALIASVTKSLKGLLGP